ncbi:ABC transporter substrate-binding protein [Aldersonia sp. NBC_00410]|uniref:ABC transporter substrate-binding protein n=1 Tax=Aldersonia sp. NBC_00410 TaxID=2975954 RepID=UPI002B1DFBE3|nr:ABC transporter substrate-binding protein [Aldersonia sp. NBC_00410]
MYAIRRWGRVPVLLLAATAVVASLSTGCSSEDEPDNAVSADAPLPTEIPPGTKLVIADQSERQQGFLGASGEREKLPFAAEFANFVGGPAILEAFRAGAADVALVGDTPPIQAQLAGQDVPIIAAFQADPNSIRITVGPDKNINSLADLKGHKIAFAEGTAQQVVVLRALEKANLKPDDVELVRLQLSEFPDAVRTGQVDAAPLSEPTLTRVLRTPGTHTISEAEAEGTATGLSFLYARREALQDPAKAAALRAYVASLIRAVQWTNEHPDEFIAKYYVGGQKLKPEEGEAIVDSLGAYAFPHLDQELVDRQQDTIDVIDRAGQLPKEIEAADGFDLRFDEVITQTVTETGAGFERETS